MHYLRLIAACNLKNNFEPLFTCLAVENLLRSELSKQFVRLFVPAKAIVAEGAINNAGSQRVELFHHFLSSRGLWIESHSQVLLFNSTLMSDFNSRIEFFISFLAKLCLASNLWITKWSSVATGVCESRFTIYWRPYSSINLWKKLPAAIVHENGALLVSARARRCCASLPETESLAAARFYATIGEIFYYQRSAKNRGKKSETESEVNVQLKSQLRMSFASSIALRTEAPPSSATRFTRGRWKQSISVVSITQNSDDDASVIDFRSSGMIHACAQR